MAPEVIAALQADSAVAAVDLGSQTRIEILPFALKNRSVTQPTHRTGPRPRPASETTQVRGSQARRGQAGPLFRYLSLIGTTAAAPPYPMEEGKWINASGNDEGEVVEAVISRGPARDFGVTVGDELDIKHETTTTRIRIVGIVDQVRALPTVGRGSPAPSRGPATTALYVSMSTWEKITSQSVRIDYAAVALKEGTEAGTFKHQWNQKLIRQGETAQLQTPVDIQEDLRSGRSVSSVRGQAYSATGISMLASLFIIFTTLSMGVHERTRQFAVLRAIALSRRQIAGIIACESLLLGTIGWLGGMAAGWGLLQMVAWTQPDFLQGGAVLGIWSMTLSAICAFGGAVAAAIVPAFRATRVSPLEAMAPRPIAPPARYNRTGLVAGLTLVVVNPLLVFVVPMPDHLRIGLYAAVGCSTMAIGFLLLSPLAIVITEKFLTAPLAWAFRLDGRLLESQLSSNFWRTLGTSVALTLGLGLFIATQVWGYSMLGPFVPGNWAPDTLVNFTTGGLPETEWKSVAHVPGVQAGRCLPLAVEQPKLAVDVTHSHQRSSVTRQDNIVLVGLDPQRAIGSDNPLLKLDFVQGNAAEVAERLALGGACVVPDHFVAASNLRLGDSIELTPPYSPEQRVTYEIAGVVRLPGWHWMTKFSGLRRQSGRSSAMVFASYEDVRRDFDLPATNFFWMETEPDADPQRLGAALQAIGDRYEGERQPVNGQGRWEFAARNFGRTVRLTTVDDVQSRIENRAAGIIWGMGQLPLVTLAVSALGVLNTILASVRTRQWDMGVLRSLGLTRWALVRLILAEGCMIALVACTLSLGFGLLAGWCGVGISQYVSFFGGMAPTLVVPWRQLLLGSGLTLVLCLAAALWPAIATGRQEPLRLLQAGRSLT